MCTLCSLYKGKEEGIDTFASTLSTTRLNYIARFTNYSFITSIQRNIRDFYTHIYFLSTFVSINPSTPKFHITKTCRSVSRFLIRRSLRSPSSSIDSSPLFAAIIAGCVSALFAAFYIFSFVFFFSYHVFSPSLSSSSSSRHSSTLGCYDCPSRARFCSTKFSNFASPVIVGYTRCVISQ